MSDYRPQNPLTVPPATAGAPVMTAGVTRMNEGMEGTVWNILGQIYVPKQRSVNSMSWHATFPVGTFVPPHIHPTQDEFLYILDGRFDFTLDGKPAAEELVTARPADPDEDVNAELDPEVAERALRQVAENEQLQRDAAYDDDGMP